ncbi:MAG TPA: DUF2723 domain-containing protein [Thermodesulfovibrio thiophilus]|nr:DUF2723 domain-containing protein [Thermodesulfovibrio thiophilus]HQA04420.1 DUF2723 domain-containing protein [Thermodesulfovibrio thiophilus]HQD36930.1 DUF2723 domain-containing protein [Thermodesulfovibrio thiophilus]
MQNNSKITGLVTFAFFLFCYIYFSSPVVNTGDAGEFIVSSYTLGLAHPSGYPLYLQMGKILQMIPFGNMAFRLVLVSVIFSILSLYILFNLVMLLAEDRWSALFSCILLFVSYSFWGQSVIAKFYTLNMFIISLILLIGIIIIIKGFDKRLVYLSGFLIGVSSSNHHLGLGMVIPFLFVLIFNFKKSLKHIPLMIVFGILGFLVNIYMFLRGNGTKGFVMTVVYDLNSFLSVFLRKNYAEGSSTALTGSIFTNISNFYYAVKNIGIILDENFSFYTFPLAIFGLIYIFQKSKKTFIFLVMSFFVYSLILAKMTFAAEVININTWYLGAHQYFIPMLFIYALFCGAGMFMILNFLYRSKFNILKRAVPVLLCLFPLVGIMERMTDQNFNSNFVPYSMTKSILSSQPVGSLYVTFGDNHTFQTWYLKVAGRYREDICSVDSLNPQIASWNLRACRPSFLYKPLVSELFNGDLLEIAKKGRVQGVIFLGDNHPMSKVFRNEYGLFVSIYLPRNTKSDVIIKKNLISFKPYADITMNDCLLHLTDDYFTMLLCNVSSTYYAHLGSLFQVKQSLAETLITKKITHEDYTTEMKFKVNWGVENEDMLLKYHAVNKKNDIKIFRYFPYSKEAKHETSD